MAENDLLLQFAEDNSLRPYNVGVTEHDKSLASVILYKSTENIGPPPENIDYTSSFDVAIPSVQSEIEPTGGAKEIIGSEVTIPRLNNFGGPNNKYYGIFNNFSLTRVVESQEQNIKIHENFSGNWNAFFFGEKPEIYRFEGFFLDTMEYPYYQEFLEAYELYLAGRKCVENKMEMKIVYDGRIVDGYILNMSTVNTSGQPFMKNFAFSMLVRGTSWLRENFVAKRSIPGYPEGYGRVREFNGFSNEYRLSKQYQTGILSSETKEQAIEPSLINRETLFS